MNVVKKNVSSIYPSGICTRDYVEYKSVDKKLKNKEILSLA